MKINRFKKIELTFILKLVSQKIVVNNFFANIRKQINNVRNQRSQEPGAVCTQTLEFKLESFFSCRFTQNLFQPTLIHCRSSAHPHILQTEKLRAQNQRQSYLCIREKKKIKANTNLHEQRVPIVNGIPQLKGEHRVGVHPPAPLPYLVRRQPVLVEPVVPADPLEGLDLAAQQPVAGLVDHPDRRVAGIVGAELPAAALLLAVEVELGPPEDGQLGAPVPQAEGRLALEPGLVGVAHRQDYRDRLVHLFTVVYQALQVLDLRAGDLFLFFKIIFGSTER